MRYLMFVCSDPEAEKYVPEEDNIKDWVDEMDRRRVRILGNRLRGVEDATTVRRRKGKVLVTDGPFAETKECIAGFDLLECADLDEAGANGWPSGPSGYGLMSDATNACTVGSVSMTSIPFCWKNANARDRTPPSAFQTSLRYGSLRNDASAWARNAVSLVSMSTT